MKKKRLFWLAVSFKQIFSKWLKIYLLEATPPATTISIDEFEEFEPLFIASSYYNK